MKTIQKDILEHARKEGYVTHSDIEYIFEAQGFNYKGDFIDCSETNDNIVFWCGWNQEAYSLLHDLLIKGFIVKDVATPLVVFLMGKGLALPRVTRRYNYKTEHWLPVMFRLA